MASLLLADCSSAPDATAQAAGGGPELRHHVFALDADGRPLASSDLQAVTHEPDCDATSGDLGAARFVCIVEAAASWHRRQVAAGLIAPDATLKLTLVFNGGRNDAAWGVYLARSVIGPMLADGQYPIVMFWPTELDEVYWQDVREADGSRVAPAEAKLRRGGTAAADLLRGLAAAPPAMLDAMRRLAAGSLPPDENRYRMARDQDLRVPPGGLVTADRNLVVSDQADADPVLDKNGVVALERIPTLPTRVLTTVLGGGMGYRTWHALLDRARATVAGPDGCRADTGCDWIRFPRGPGGFGQFFHWLDACIESTGERGADSCPAGVSPATVGLLRRADITLIGHSLATVVIDHIVTAFPHLPYTSIVFLGGATSIRAAADAIVPLLREHRGCTRFYNLMLHPLDEQRERSLNGLTLSGSLLVWIDGFLEHPGDADERTIGQWVNLREAREVFPADVRGWILLRVFDRQAADPMQPSTHSGLMEPERGFWRPAFWGADRVRFEPAACPAVPTA